MEKMTLKELSERIATGRDDAALVSRRIRHWTNEQLIPTEGDIFSGRGRHRYYNMSGLLIAAVLWELSRYDVPVGVLDKVKPKLDDIMTFVLDNLGSKITSDTFDKKHWMWLAISFDDESGKFDCTYFNREEVLTQKTEAASVIIINMEKIAQRVT